MGKTRVIAETGAGQHGVATRDRLRAARASSASSTWAREDMRAPGAERPPHAAARRRGARGRLGRAHAQGRDQRGDARLGHERAHDALPARLGAGRAPVPDDGARLPGGDRRGGARRRSCDADGRACPTCWSPAWAAARTRSGSSARSSTTPCEMVGVEAGGRALDAGRARRALPGRVAGRRGRRPPRHAHVPAAGRRGQRAADALGLGRPRLSGGRARARAAARPRARALRLRARRGGARRVPPAGARRRASSPRSSRRTRSPGWRASAQALQGPRGRGEPLRPRRQGPGDVVGDGA